MNHTPRSPAAVCCALLVLGLTALQPDLTAQASPGPDIGHLHHTRTDLERLLSEFEQASRAPAYSSALRGRANAEARLVRHRLDEGDFQVGDQIALSVQDEPALSATFVVRPGRILTLPSIGDVALRGILRSELNAHLEAHLSRYIRDPVIESRSLVRVWVDGEVRQPGFYGVPSESLLSDILMVAGGLGPNANLTGIRIERRTEPIWEGQLLQDAISRGRTIDQLSLQAGDRIMVPQKGPTGMTNFRTLIATVPPALLTIIGLIQLL